MHVNLCKILFSFSTKCNRVDPVIRRPVVNFTNILQAVFLLISLRQKCFKPKLYGQKAALKILVKLTSFIWLRIIVGIKIVNARQKKDLLDGNL
jgi:hypothetical protein